MGQCFLVTLVCTDDFLTPPCVLITTSTPLLRCRSEVRSLSFSGDGRHLAVLGEELNVHIVSTVYMQCVVYEVCAFIWFVLSRVCRQWIVCVYCCNVSLD